MKILVIDDDPNIIETVSDVLKAEGYTVAGAEDGITGLRLIENFSPDAVICDLKMPILDGHGVLKAVRENPRTATIPFILLSALKERGDVRGGMDRGADDYLTKPFTPAELLNTVKARLEKQRKAQTQARRRLDQLRDSMAMSLPHELLTPLNGILGYSRFLKEEIEQLSREEIRELAQGIDLAGKRLERLIRKFLLYAEIQMIGEDPERSWLLKGDRTHTARETVMEAAGEAGHDANRQGDLSFDLHDVEIRMAEKYWKAIVLELIENAFKFSEPGSPVKVSLNSAGTSAVFSVIDRGRGMTPAQVADVGAYVQFERKVYEQQGAGLGLIVVKRLTELHNGTFEVTSAPGRETTVRITLPSLRH